MRSFVQNFLQTSKDVMRRVNSIIVALIMVSSLMVFFPVRVGAADETFTGSTTINTNFSTNIPIDLQIAGSGDEVLPVKLEVPSGSLQFGTISGLTFSGSSSGTRLQFSGTRSDINTALATLTFSPATPGQVSLDASITEQGYVYNPASGHVYYVVEDLNGLTWSAAKTAAEGLSVGGVSGYLATITSQEENDFIRTRVTNNLPQNPMIGAEDTVTEGEWNWATGPETGTTFWEGDANGTVVGSNFTNWHPGEPNNGNGGAEEDCAQMVVGGIEDGAWNDIECDFIQLYYLVEFGEPSNLAQVVNRQITITTTVEEETISSCSDLLAIDSNDVFNMISLANDIDCNGEAVEPLFSSQPFRGTLDGNGYTISNVSIDQNADYAALLAQTEGAIIKDLTLSNFTVSAEGYQFVASLVGNAENTDIENVDAKEVDITGGMRVGGLVGRFRTDGSSSSYLRNASSTGVVVSTTDIDSGFDAGGLVGMIEAENTSTNSVERVYSEADIQGGTDVGGLFGEVESDGSQGSAVIVRNVYTWGDVSGITNNIGGLIGRYDLDDNDTLIMLENAYAYGDVSQDGADNAEVGGLIGGVDERQDGGENGTIRNSFAMGEVTGTGQNIDIGGFVGRYDATEGNPLTLENNYYDQSLSTQTKCNQDDNMQGCTAVNTDGSQANYFINNSSNEPMASWDFATVWRTNSTMPPTFKALDESSSVSFISPLTNKQITLELTGGCTFEALFNQEEEFATKDAAFDYPNGLVGFNADCGTPGITTTVTHYYYGVEPSNFIARKYSSRINGYFTLNDAVIENVTVDGQQATKVTYQVTDGSERDIDGVEDGMINDPAGLARSLVGAPNTGLSRN